MTSVAPLALAAALTATTTHAAPLIDALQPLEPFLGAWEVQATWAGGIPMSAHTTYRPILQGHFIEARVLVSDNHQPVKLKYITIFAPTEDPETFTVHSFTDDGQLQTTTLTITTHDDKPALASAWPMGDLHVRETLEIPAADTAAWNVWITTPTAPESLALSASWQRSTNPAPVPADQPLNPALEPLAPLLGTRDLNTAWPDARPLWARFTAAPMPSGNLIHAAVHARDDHGPQYHRYRTFYTHDPATSTITETTFTHTGDMATAHLTHDPDRPDTIIFTYPSETPGAPLITKSFHPNPDDTLDLLVTMTAHNTEPRTLLEGTWRPTPEELTMTTPIDTTRFAAGGTNTRHFSTSTTINAPTEAVFAAFADADAFKAAYDPDRPELAANIDLAIGGRYEWLFDGHTGSNNCQVLSYIPNRMISFSWNAPTSQPDSRRLNTWVVVETTPAPDDDNATAVTITHLGFGDAPHWDETRDYFAKAWPFVLEQLKTNLEAP